MAVKIGISADHGGFDLKEYLKSELTGKGYGIKDFGNNILDEEDDYPDYVVPMGREIANGQIQRGIAVCGSGVGACIAINKLKGVRACLITDIFSAHQGVEDDNMNVICLGGRVLGQSLALEIAEMFLKSEYIGAERHKRRLDKVEELESE